MDQHFTSLKGQLSGFIKKSKFHLISWGCFISYEIVVAGLLGGRFSSFGDYLIHYAINILLFYFHATVLLPFTLRGRRYWLIPLLVAAEIAGYIGLTYGMEYLATRYFNLQMTRPLAFDYFYCLRSLWRAVYFIGFATGYYCLVTALRERRGAEEAKKQHLLDIIENQNLQHELIKAQNAFLKAQINPHFLFNTLNFIYNCVRKTSSKASETVLALSQMMRYALQSEEEYQQTDLMEEIEHVENLIHIHQIRHQNELHIRLQYSENLSGIKFIPLVLITLVENIFKHGDLSQPKHAALIEVTRTNNTLLICTHNLRTAGRPISHHIGLDNTRKRLQHAYKEKFCFEAYADAEGYFHTTIKVELSDLPVETQLADTQVLSVHG